MLLRPLTCPYVTGVGGTQINNGDTIYDPQHVFFQPFEPRKMYKNANGTSGGGFSNIYPIPDYQKKALDTYFTQHNPPQKSYCKLATDDPSNPYALPNLTALAGESCASHQAGHDINNVLQGTLAASTTARDEGSRMWRRMR